MADNTPSPLTASEISDLIRDIRTRTPARVLVARAGPAYSTATQLELRQDHAAALDAVHAEVNLERDLGGEFIKRWGLFEIRSRAATKTEYLMRPDLGRKLEDSARARVAGECYLADLQVVIGDGLSAAAVGKQVPGLLPLLDQRVQAKGWTWGKPFFVRHCRVGILNDIGDILKSEVVVLLIGERPGLATAESLSAYMAYRPQVGHTDAQRNLISNIHGQGVPLEEAARRIVALAERMRRLGCSGVAVKEDLLWAVDGEKPTLLGNS